MTNITIKTREYAPDLYRRGLPYRINGGDFVLKDACKSVQLGDNNVHGKQGQEGNYRVACQDESGWLMYILAASTLDRAKHVAGNIMAAYHADDKNTFWVQTLDGFKPRAATQLYIFDALFEDDNAYRRSMFYDAIQRTDSPQVSVIVIGRSDDPLKFSKHLGLKPNLLIHLK